MGFRPVEFSPRDIVFSRDAALRGIYERVAIKWVQAVNNDKTSNINVLYVDTFNFMWNEWDLIKRSEADTLVEDYYQNILDQYP
jgi:hypothetical protein